MYKSKPCSKKLVINSLFEKCIHEINQLHHNNENEVKGVTIFFF